MAHSCDNKTRILAKLIREELRKQPFETLADLTDALKRRIAQLKLTVLPEDISVAYCLIATNTKLVLKPTTMPQEPLKPLGGSPDSFSKSDAARIYRALLQRYRAERPEPSNDGAPEYFPALVLAER